MREYILVFAVALAATYAATPMVRRLAIRIGAITPVRDRDVHSTPIPRLGGVAILIGFLTAVAVGGRLPHLHCLIRSEAGFCGPSGGGTEIRGIVVGAVIVTLVGAIDDLREMDWLTKLAGQIIAAGAMAYSGVQLLSLPILGVTVLPAPVLMVVTVVIVLVTTNAVNFIDGLDGLAAGIVGIAALAFFIYVYGLSHSYNPPNVFSTATFVSAATLGCCVGFLPHNFHPARLFMGDAGALLLGLLLAASTIAFVGNVDPAVEVEGNAQLATYLPIVLPLAVMMIPLLDMTLAVIRRTRRGQSPWSPDAQHLQHQMLRIGHSHPGAVLMLYLWAAIIAFGAVSLAYVQGPIPLLTIGVAILAALWLTGRLPKWLESRRL
ncbi:Decaprenyl-phosphate N-acetylglucosaminephosphotransferase [Austwickia sp. TVS 96-490-7B]|uniref:MraY family glycosyltransferase n=1 Tax=Austwickia sp. TVS 96-490-7B TaxID=2830843 RepID=UPI001C5A4972|nr:MraY family glycosyltransferase [Austwickia sp. TVS 96-490-7B]MBW3084595.1 Decaprenyl-phosphate N-acetylglucosaminephosphotransferase [Austwickia sp. TVS 96-490-7B]